MSPEDLAIREVEARHRAFAAWFAEADEAALEATARAFALDMERVAPDGAAQGREDLLEGLRGAGGAGTPAIAVEDARVLWAEGDAALVAYVERQSGGGRQTTRRSTALMTLDEGAPGGVAWRFVQETWIDDGERSA